MKIKKLVTLTCAFVMVLSVCVAPASAANVKDTNYYQHSSAGNWVGTVGRYKENTSYVYVYPSSSPSGKTRVQTDCYVGGRSTNKTQKGCVYLKDGHKYAITNYVYEDGDRTTGRGVFMWLGLTPDSGSGYMSGVWSPDWTGSGTVTIV